MICYDLGHFDLCLYYISSHVGNTVFVFLRMMLR